MSSPENYTVRLICAITTEYVAAQAFLMKSTMAQHICRPHNKKNNILGKTRKHNVVISGLPLREYGTSSAARVAEDMMHNFPNIHIGLMVGIGGGAPGRKHEIRPGDIVVSTSRNGQGSVIQYDYGKTIQGQIFQQTGDSNQPPTILRAAVNGHALNTSAKGIIWMMRRKESLRRSRDYGTGISITHPSGKDLPCASRCGDDPSCLVARPLCTEKDDNPAVHYALIASVNQLMEDASIWDKLAAQKDVLCFEMEAAGLMNHFPCLVIRDICEYADSHKNKNWQGYAAMVAAA
ncbi:uncharacterized protein N7477_007012 [Penicillium maclennaniae]|uniref:uncharacterized protein n=1 Tax=Penicillium maclennaniae TaxID=1343394 RepID=UPI00254043E9|nr:uncharacterized protein N7477_007012 [Penicillium maclennaniae]KAJ5668442.1 hypothetical protein N7477_007012 [Penicillium maclennaniae]